MTLSKILSIVFLLGALGLGYRLYLGVDEVVEKKNA